MRHVVVGAGIVGLAVADALHRRGESVTVVDRDAFASGASVRNFGMVWPIGQRLGEERDRAMRSRERWLEIARAAGLWHRECGSLHLAYAQDELAVMEEFRDLAGPEVGDVLDAKATLRRCPAIREKGLLGSFWSPWEVCVDPREAVHGIARWLQAQGVEFRFGQIVTGFEPGMVRLDQGTIEADRVWLCTGPSLNGLLGGWLEGQGLQNCRLQMMRASLPDSLGTHLCAGLTLLHYRVFEGLSSLGPLRARLEAEHPDAIRLGIHVLVSQHGDGTVTLGDTHEYGHTFAPYSSERADEIVLEYLDGFLPTDRMRILERWQGVYIRHSEKLFVAEEIAEGVVAFNGVGGAGMTLSFGAAEEVVARYG